MEIGRLMQCPAFLLSINTVRIPAFLNIQIYIVYAIEQAIGIYNDIFAIDIYTNSKTHVAMARQIMLCVQLLLWAIHTSHAQKSCVAIGSGGVEEQVTTTATPQGFLIGGQKNNQIYLVHVDTNYNVIWDMIIDTLSNGKVTALLKTSNNHYIVAARGWQAGRSQTYLMRLDGTGNVVWEKFIQKPSSGFGPNIPQIHSLTELNDNQYIGVGVYRTNGYIIKFDSSGHIISEFELKGTSYEELWDVVSDDEGSIVAVGWTASFGAGSKDVLIVKFANDSSIQWAKTVGGAQEDIGFSIVQSEDSGYVVSGLTYSFGAGGRDIYVIKLTKEGDTLWTRTIGGSSTDLAFDAVKTDDNHFVFCGYSNSFYNGKETPYLVKLDPSGNMKWTRLVGAANFWRKEANTIINLANGEFLIAGNMMHDFGNGGNDIFLSYLTRSGEPLVCATECLSGTGGTIGSGGIVTDISPTVEPFIGSWLDTISKIDWPASSSVKYPNFQLSITVDRIDSASCATCSDGAIYLSISGGNPPYSHRWNSGDTVEDPTNLLPGIYADSIRDGSGCLTVAGPFIVASPQASGLSDWPVLPQQCKTFLANGDIVVECDRSIKRIEAFDTKGKQIALINISRTRRVNLSHAVKRNSVVFIKGYDNNNALLFLQKVILPRP